MPPRRKPSDIVSINLRIREFERRLLAAAAEGNRVSLNGEMAARLMASFEQRSLLSIKRVQEDLESYLLPLFDKFDKLQRQESLVRAAERLVDHLQPLLGAAIDGPEAETIKRDISAIRLAVRAIAAEWDRRRPGGPADQEWRRGLPGGTEPA